MKIDLHICRGMILLGLLGIFFCLGSLAHGAIASEKGFEVGGVEIKDAQGKKVLKYAGSYALLIEESEYTAGWKKLTSVPKEMDQVEATLKKQGFEIRRVRSPGSVALKKAFEDFIGDYGYKQDNRLLIYYSGHGYTFKKDEDAYLVPSDSPLPENQEGFLKKALNMEQIDSWAKQIKANHALFVFDSCFSGTIFLTRGLDEQPDYISDMSAKPVRQYITAGEAGQEVPAKSTFTPAFVDALERRKADSNNDGYVTGMELGLYLQQTVWKYKIQNPQYGKISRYELAQGDFVFRVGVKGEMDKPMADISAPPAVAPTRIRSNEEIEQELWDSIKDSDNAAPFQEYFNQYPKGKYVAAAKVMIAKFKNAGATAAVQEEARQKRDPQPGQVFRDCPDCPDMVVIPDGDFMMGSTVGETGRENDESPLHQVSLGKFGMGAHEITVGEFRRFVQSTGYRTDSEKNAGNASGCYAWDASDGKFDWRAGRYWDNPGFSQTPQYPVVCVSWNDAQAYVQWLAKETGKKYRLPSEAEWEYAARAGTTTARYWGANPNDACIYANVADITKGPGGVNWSSKQECNDGYFFSAPVGSFKPNVFGLYDMIGNALEWVEDSYHDNYNGAPKNGSAWGGDGAKRVLRGGSWYYTPQGSRAAKRFGFETAFRYGSFGFRLARMLP